MKLPELPELTGLPEWIEEDENFQKASALVEELLAVPVKTPPKQIEFDKYGRMIKNPNKGIVNKKFMGTKGSNPWADKE